MSRISFVTAKDAQDYERKAFAKLPPDTLIDGRVSPVQYTVRWDIITDKALTFELEYRDDTPDLKGTILLAEVITK